MKGQSFPYDPSIYVYFLISDSPPTIYSKEYSIIYEALQSLFGDDPIPEDEALETLTELGHDLRSAESKLAWMTKYHYLHRAKLAEVLK